MVIAMREHDETIKDEEKFVLVKISKDGHVLRIKNVADRFRYQPFPEEEYE